MSTVEVLSTTDVRETRRNRRNGGIRPGFVIALAFIAFILIAAFLPALIATRDPLVTTTRDSLMGPGFAHWFGADQLGRDIFSRVIYGSRYSLTVGLSATAIALVGGTLIGAVAGLGPRVVDGLLMRVVDLLLAFPELLVALVVIAMLGPGQTNVLYAISIAAIPAYARLVRVEVRLLRGSGFIEAAVAQGQSRTAIVLRHIVPNALGPLLVLATIGVGTAIIAGAGLSFLGLGPTPPTPEWGLLLSDGRNFLTTAWWMAVFPGLFITGTVISFTVVGRHLQARFEGRRP